MSGDITTFARISATGNDTAPVMYSFLSTTDAMAIIKASGYFDFLMQDLTNGIGVIKVNDVLLVRGTDGDALLNVTAVTTAVTTSEFSIAEIDANSVKSVDLYRADGISFQYTGTWKSTATARPTSDYAYFHEIDADEFVTGGAAQKTYLLGISGERPVGSAATGDSNDAIIKGSMSNYAACDSNFIMRGVNTSVTNRPTGTLGILEGAAIGAQNKSGGVSPTIRGMTIRGENYGTNATEFGVLDVNCSDEVGAGTLRYGLRVRNTDASGVAAMGHGLLFSSSATNGFDNVITVQNKADTFADFDAATGNVAGESGSAATSWKFRVKVVSPDGTDCWINAYSTSNA